MLPEFLLTNSNEFMMLNLVVGFPVMFLGYWFVYRMHLRGGARSRFRFKPLWWAGALTMFGIAILLDRIFVSPFFNYNGDPWRYAWQGLGSVLIATVLAGLSIIVVGNLRRGLITAASGIVYLVLQEGYPFHPVFTIHGATETLVLHICLMTGVAGLCFGTVFMTSPSHISRALAALSACWGMKLLSWTIMSAHRPAASILNTHYAQVSPLPVMLFSTVLLVGIAIAYVESRRLRSDSYRTELLADSEERMRLLAEASQEAIVVTREGVIEDANANFRTLSGHDAPVGLPLGQILPCIETEKECDGDDMLGERPGDRFVTESGHEVRVKVHSQDLGDGRVVHAIRDLTSAHRAQSRIRDLAANDGLTGIANRRTFDETVDAATETPPADGTHLVLMMIDLDRFKPVNDTYGHGVGDEVLRRMADRFKALVREDDLLARIGGDEFALLAHLDDRAAGGTLAARLVEEASRPFEMNDLVVSLGASVGYASHRDVERSMTEIDGTGDLAADRLRHAADLALYAAKDAGRGRAVAFEPLMAREASDRLALEADLRVALRRGELLLHYQVQQEVSTGRVVGFEALMRWSHPVRGMIPPSVFIPIAEETGLIVSLGRWALRQAAQDFAAFPDGMRVSVNVSPLQFTGSDVPADVRAALEESGLDPARLELEITEELLINDTEGTLATLNELRALGVNLSLDDFGSGYSSLAYLTRFPFSKIKIDRCFIEHMMSDERSHQLVKSILALASSLKLRVTAEGVETHGQLLHLAKGACDEAQGYLLGRPAALDDVRTVLELAKEDERLAG